MASRRWWRGLCGLAAAVWVAAGLPAGQPARAAGLAEPRATVVAPEGNDFATRVLADPWDMNALSDVSIYLNRSGQSYDTENIQVANGVFSARSRTDDANFTVLFPGYEDMIKTGNMGALKPINSSTYHCLYTAMYVEGGSPQSYAQPMWFATARLNGDGGVWGYATVGTPGVWLLQKIDLATVPGAGPTPWPNSATWQGLRIDPTNQPGRDFSVDWVRLTDCAPVNVTVHWGPNSSISSIWLRPSGTSRNILVKGSGVVGSSGQAQIDVQGVQPGTYEVWVGTNTSAPSTKGSDTLVVNQAPIAQFVTPSAYSGSDYATQAGNPWDFAANSDVESTHNFAAAFQNGVLDMVTQSGPWPQTLDAQFFLNTPQDFSGSQYRYLNFRMFTEWTVTSPFNGLVPWPNMPDGMVTRLVWSIPGVSGAPTNRCYFVSHDIPFDIGWHTYTIDLYDAYNGRPEENTQNDCPATSPSWSGTSPIKEIRFDPNENVTGDPGRDPITTGGPFHQQLDWLKLTAPDRVARGTPYLIQIDLNRPASDLNSITYYYTTSRSDPTQHTAARWTPPGAGQGGPYKVRLPLLQFGGGVTPGADTLPQPDTSFWWNTANVTPGAYYLCATLTMSPNTATYCSDVPMLVQ
ncbi:MAG: hypothetical protein IT317_09270 [Anaerolineales bacterium]|nr:hypothetical protein [Anaerolineales bacterium]